MYSYVYMERWKCKKHGILVNEDHMLSFSGDKTPVFFTMVHKRKPSLVLGDIIKIMMIVKLAITILHLLK